MIDYIVLAILAVIIIAAGRYVYRAKKSGKKCIGCPEGGSCSQGCSHCGSHCGGRDPRP